MQTSRCLPNLLPRQPSKVFIPLLIAIFETNDQLERHSNAISDLEENTLRASAKSHAVFATKNAVLPSVIDQNTTQIVQFGTGIEFKSNNTSNDSSTVILPCVFGSQLEGPVLLATGTVPVNVPFSDSVSLRKYYEGCKSISVVVNDQMTDNARNLAGSYRINALFIVQPSAENSKDISSFLDSVNINAVTALAGPQSLGTSEIHILPFHLEHSRTELWIHVSRTVSRSWVLGSRTFTGNAY